MAISLGLHREESIELRDIDIQRGVGRARRNLWRSLFIVDRFLLSCLGRPVAISDDDSSEHALDPWQPSLPRGNVPVQDGVEDTCREAASASVRASVFMGATNTRMYSKRKFSTSIASEIKEGLPRWVHELPPSLHWSQLLKGPIGVIQGMAILHVNLLGCHSVMLLTRPFFLFVMRETLARAPRSRQDMDPLAQACVEASQHTIVLAKAALDGGMISRCNPFVM